MGKQLYNKFSDDFVKDILLKYLSGDLSVKQILEILKLKRTRFFELLKQFKKDPQNFTISYKRKSKKRISPKLENIIFDESKKDKVLIDNKDIPIRNFNYSYLKDQIYKNYNLKVGSVK